jgi:hypothetical protein
VFFDSHQFLISRYLNNFPLGMIVAQYSVHAIAGPEPDYGIHFPNIRSPEGWQKDDARAPGMLLNDASPTSPEKRSNRFHTHSANYLNRNSEHIINRLTFHTGNPPQADCSHAMA